MTRRQLVSLAVMLGLTGAAAAQIHDPRALEADPATAEGPIAPVLEGLGDYHYEVTTSVAASQRFFDQGLRLTYGFNHSEALRAFKEAARLDPDNAMAYWGWASVLGPNINLPMQPAVAEQAWRAAQQALARAAGVSDHERALIEAMAVRFAPPEEVDPEPADPWATRAHLDQAFADAMAAAAARFPEDPEVNTVYADALMNLTPWNYWERDGRPRPGTEQLLAVLESVLERDPDHPGALHLYVHAVEARHPERGVAAADALRGLMPGVGHMVHMPSHIYMRVGRFADSYEDNVKAVAADERYITQCRAQGLYPLAYYPHNLHFMVWSAMFRGRSAEALAAAEKVAEQTPDNPEGNAWGLFDTFMAQPLYTMVRFGQWGRLLREPQPDPERSYLLGIWHYGRGLALAHAGKLRPARRELRALAGLRDGIGDYPMGFASAETLLTIATEVLAGEIDLRRGRLELGLAHLERAVRLEDSLLYNEPPDWYFPVRHYLGAALLEAGLPVEAEVVYGDDLRRNPENGFGLFGMAAALAAQGREEAAAAVRRRFESAWGDADVELASSRY